MPTSPSELGRPGGRPAGAGIHQGRASSARKRRGETGGAGSLGPQRSCGGSGNSAARRGSGDGGGGLLRAARRSQPGRQCPGVGPGLRAAALAGRLFQSAAQGLRSMAAPTRFSATSSPRRYWGSDGSLLHRRTDACCATSLARYLGGEVLPIEAWRKFTRGAVGRDPNHWRRFAELGLVLGRPCRKSIRRPGRRAGRDDGGDGGVRPAPWWSSHLCRPW